MAAAHVPAWKKLGLKLKYAKDVPAEREPILATIEPADSTTKRKLSVDAPGQGSGKKAKHGARGKENGNPTESALANELASPGNTPVSSTSRKRKSVSFAEDTKETDGGRNPKELYKAVSIRKLAKSILDENNDDESPKTSPTSSPIPETPSARPAEKKSKKPKTAKPAAAASRDSLEIPQQPGWISKELQYLDEYQNSRPTWKFNKARQTHIIKRALSLEKIPSSYSSALRNYIMGLDSREAHLRLHERAREVIDADDAALARETEEEAAGPASASSNNDAEDDDKEMEDGGAVEASSSSPGSSKKTDNKSRRTTDRSMYRGAVANIKETIDRGEDPGSICNDMFKTEEWRSRIAKRQRAEILLWATSQSIARMKQSPSSPAAAPVVIDVSKPQQERPSLKSEDRKERNKNLLKERIAAKRKTAPESQSSSASDKRNGTVAVAATSSTKARGLVTTTNGNANGDGATIGKKRKRKKRRTTLDISESSSESSSDEG